MDSSPASTAGIYRPGYPFTGPELQTMTSQGVLRHMLADVYAESALPDTCEVRATAAAALLSKTLRTSGVLCGETAAWVHLGRWPPMRAAVITQGVYRRPTDGPWRIYQVRLEAGQTQPAGRMKTTTPSRTAADIFCGIGAAGSRRALDQLGGDSLHDQLYYWPAVAEPLEGRDQRIWNPAPADQQVTEHRMALIGELMATSSVTQEAIVQTVMGVLSASENRRRRTDRIAELLDQCASRRLPTVR